MTITRNHNGTRWQLPVVISELPIDEAIGVSFTHGQKQFYTKCKITAYFGSHTAELREGFYWNGADEPRLFWTVLGVDPTGIQVIIATGFHDDGCERSDIPQVMVDGVFVSLLKDIRFNGRKIRGLNKWKARAMYAGVRFYSIVCRPIVRRMKWRRKEYRDGLHG